MRYCKQCDRDLADQYTECPFCKEPTEAKVVEVNAPSQEEIEARKRSASERRHKRAEQKKMLGAAMIVLIIISVITMIRWGDTEVAFDGEWIVMHRFSIAVMGGDSEGELPYYGIIQSKAELDALVTKNNLTEFSGDVDFEKSSLIFKSTIVRRKVSHYEMIEKITANMFNTWALIAEVKLPSHMRDQADAVTGTWRYQLTHFVAVPKLSGYPTEETLSTPFSRKDKM